MAISLTRIMFVNAYTPYVCMCTCDRACLQYLFLDELEVLFQNHKEHEQLETFYRQSNLQILLIKHYT